MPDHVLMKGTRHLEVGRVGEAAAEAYFLRNGYRIVARNDRTKRAEIDLIVQKDGVLVFVEVKTRSDESLGSPEETLSQAALRRLRRHAQVYVASCRWTGACRIDAVCVVVAQGPAGREGQRVTRLDHYENITA